jgi:LPXTG-motif cell wall-anchored protein
VPAPRPAQRLAVAGLTLVLAAIALLALPAQRASAVVTPRYGYRATVDGFTSWYGSYGMAGLGTAWCIDHGIHAPDPAFAYRAADLTTIPPRTRTAMAWVLGRYATGTDRVRHAAVMLVLHDLMGATYPSGRLDVDRLAISRLAGFGGREADVLAQARALKRDGLQHAHLRGAVLLRVRVGTPDARGAAPVTVGLTDAAGQPIAGIPVALAASAGTTLVAPSLVTDATGTARTIARPVRLPLTVRANAVVPRLDLDAWAPTTRRAQRVARPAVDAVAASTSLAAPPTTAPPTTTTSTTSTSTTTTLAPTTTTTATTPASTTATTIPSTTTTFLAPTTTAAPTTTVPTTVPVTVLNSPPSVPTLPRTGVDTVGATLLAIGLLLLGAAALELRREMT